MDKITRVWDVYLTAYLLTKGYRECALPQKEGHQIYFYFKSTPELEDEILNFYTRDPQIEAQTYAGHLKRVRVAVNELVKRRAEHD